MQLTTNLKNNESFIATVIIVFVVSIANYYTIFGLDMLLLDDNARYHLFSNNVDVTYARSFLGIGVFLKSATIYIFGTHSVEAARAYMLYVYMIPASILFYLFNKKFLHLSLWVSLVSAVLVNIIPRLYHIPTFLDGSYPAPAVVVFLSTLLLIAAYLENKKFSIALLLAGSIVWLVACDVAGEMSIFLSPCLLYFIYSSEAKNKRKLPAYLTIISITAYRLYFYFQFIGVNPTNKPVVLSLQTISDRIFYSIEWWLPFGKITTTIAIIISLFGLTILYSYIKQRNIVNKSPNYRAYIFYAIWFLACSSPFWFVSKYFGPRYFYISYFALTTIALMATYQFLIINSKHRKHIVVYSSVFLFILYGTQRYLINEKQFDRWNRKHTAIQSLLKKETINPTTQFALVNIKNGTGGYYIWSSGYLENLLKIPGVRGIMGNEMNFYDPFNLKHCGYTHKMSCIDINKELISYKQTPEYKTIRMTRFLQWEKQDERNSKWTLYETNNKNKLFATQHGTGIDEYINILENLSLQPEDVLWGNYNFKNSLKKLK